MSARETRAAIFRDPVGRLIIAAIALFGLVVPTILVLVLDSGPGSRLAVQPPASAHKVGTGYYTNEPLWGVTNWPIYMQLGTIVFAVATYGMCISISWHQRRFHPTLVMLIIATVLAPFFDPLISWAQFTYYDPRLLHVPENWPLVSILPTVDPLVIIPAWACFFVMSSLPGLCIYKRLVKRPVPPSWVLRWPRLSLFFIAGTFAAIVDELQGWAATRTETIGYTQLTSAAWRGGTTWQANALWESLLCFVLFGGGALILQQDARGEAMVRRWVTKMKIFGKRKLLGEFVLSFFVLVAGTGIYTGVFTILRITHSATSVACEWPYADTRVYDPYSVYPTACPIDQKPIEKTAG